MKKILVAFLCTLIGCVSIPTSAKEMVGAPVPSTRVTMLSGDYYGLDDFRGKELYILFWASWCGKSKSELESFNELASKMSGRNDMAFLAASIDKAERIDDVRGIIEKGDFTAVRHAFSGNDISDEAYLSFNAETVPHLVAIDQRGVVTLVDDDVSSLEDLIEEKR